MSIRGREGRLAATKFGLADRGIDFIECYIGNKVPQNEWLRVLGSEIYVRYYEHPTRGTTLDIANIQIRAENQRQGIFRHFLSEMEKVCWSYAVAWIHVENVFHPGLQRFLEKRGYNAIRDEVGTPSYWYNIQKGPPII